MGQAETGSGLVDYVFLGLRWRRGEREARSMIGRSLVVRASLG